MKAAAEEWRREEEEWARAYAEPFRRQFKGNLQDDAGEQALSSFGLKLSCTAEDVNRAFCKIVANEKPHPDQGGSEEAMRDLIEREGEGAHVRGEERREACGVSLTRSSPQAMSVAGSEIRGMLARACATPSERASPEAAARTAT